MLLDSNIIIYFCQQAHRGVIEFVRRHRSVVSAVSLVEVLGYHRLTADDRLRFETFFRCSPVLPVSYEVINRAVRLRQLKKLSLGDSIIAATALSFEMPLATHNVEDFQGIADLMVVDPLADKS
jgi:predicted nucleic acid-binding protein